MFVRGSTFRQSPRYRRRESLRGFDFEYSLTSYIGFILRKEVSCFSYLPFRLVTDIYL